MTGPLKIMLSAGEASGDRHAANMFLELKKMYPAVTAMGMGGAQMAEAGVEVRVDSSALAVIGVVEVIKHYPKIRRALAALKRMLEQEKPDLLICVDYKEFNYKLAKFAKKLGVKVLFYVSPQVWAWRPGRVKKYGQVIDMMAVIFPFETAYYEAEQIPVRYVGHPSVEKAHPQYSKEQAVARFGLDAAFPVVGLLPGSRIDEIDRLLPVMLKAAEAIKKAIPHTQFILPQAHSINDEVLQKFLAQSPITMIVVKNLPYDAMQCSTAIMTSSGTATLEIALLTIPMVICYKLSPMTYWLGRLLVKTPFIGLPNIIAGKAIVKELIQHEASAEQLSAEIIRLLTDKPYASQMQTALREVKERLGSGGGSKKMADLVFEMLQSKAK